MRSLSALLIVLVLVGSAGAAINPDTAWEVRNATGSITNGGGWVSCNYLSAAVVSNGGTGYDVNDVLTISGGTSLGVAATVKVTGVAGGVVTTVSIVETGGYTTNPTNAAGTTGAGDNACTLTCTWTATTDRSQQDAAYHTWKAADGDHTNDLDPTNANPSVVTSATHDFVGAEVGNMFYLSAGTNLTPGWYQIVSANLSTNTGTLDRNCMTGASSANITGTLGGALALGNSAIDSEFFAAASGNGAVPGNTVYMKGTWTLSENVTGAANDATATLPISIIGYNAARATQPYLTDRVTLAATTRSLTLGDYWVLKNFDASGTAGVVIDTGSYDVVENCKAVNTSATLGRKAFGLTTGSILANCQASCTNGTAIAFSGSYGRVVDSFMYSSAIGATPAQGSSIIHSIINNCTIDIELGAVGAVTLYGNTINGGGTSFNATTASSLCAVNNIVDATSTSYAVWTTYQKANYWNFNLWGADSPTMSNVVAGPNDIKSTAFAFTDAATLDFTLPVGSPAIDAAERVGPNVGLKAGVDYKVNIGVSQESAAVGGDFPDANNVLTTDTTNGATGKYYAVDPNKVLKTVTFGVDNAVPGTVTLPDPNYVLKTMSYGDANSVTGVVTSPDPNYVLLGTSYGDANSVDGAVTLPTEAQVQNGVAFGDANSLTGSYSGGDANTVTAVLTALTQRGLTSALVSKISTALPSAAPGAAGGLLALGTGTGQINPSGGSVPIVGGGVPTVDDIMARVSLIVPADFNSVPVASGGLTAILEPTWLADNIVAAADISGAVEDGLTSHGATSARMSYLDNIANADLLTTKAQTGDAYVPALAAKTAVENLDLSVDIGTALGSYTVTGTNSTMDQLLKSISDNTSSLR